MDCTRREFVSGALVGAAGLLGVRPETANAEPPPETTTLKLVKVPAICVAPQYVAEGLLRAEGFTDVQYVTMKTGTDNYKAMAAGQIHFSTQAIPATVLLQLDPGAPVVVLAGIHVGCFELFATARIHSVRDLKGRTISLGELRSGRHGFLATVLTHVGLDPERDVNLVVNPPAQGMQLLADGKVDAFVGFPPEPQELRARKIGHVLVNSTLDRPWSHYFCCMLVASRDFVQRYPVATKRALRAILKATNVCAREPERTARLLVDKGYAKQYEYALQTLKELPYAKWREYDPEDSVRFYALRLREARLITSTPQKIIAEGTDWRFLDELKKELKG
jgi:NitT/TauT family transport system substrate-binding protein